MFIMIMSQITISSWSKHLHSRMECDVVLGVADSKVVLGDLRLCSVKHCLVTGQPAIVTA